MIPNWLPPNDIKMTPNRKLVDVYKDGFRLREVSIFRKNGFQKRCKKIASTNVLKNTKLLNKEFKKSKTWSPKSVEKGELILGVGLLWHIWCRFCNSSLFLIQKLYPNVSKGLGNTAEVSKKCFKSMYKVLASLQQKQNIRSKQILCFCCRGALQRD